MPKPDMYKVNPVIARAALKAAGHERQKAYREYIRLMSYNPKCDDSDLQAFFERYCVNGRLPNKSQSKFN